LDKASFTLLGFVIDLLVVDRLLKAPSDPDLKSSGWLIDRAIEAFKRSG
jgi:hypothetical protein